MTRELKRLTALAARNAKPDSKGTKLYTDGGGLYLQVTPTGVRSWTIRYTLDGQPKSMGLGALHTVTLSEAREEALRVRKLVMRGIDPKGHRADIQAANALSRQRTFSTCAEEFVKSIAAEHRNQKAHDQWLSSLKRYAFPVIGNVPIADVDVHMIMEIMTRDDAWVRKTETMSRVRGRIERILGWAAVLGLRSAENPARFTKFLSEVLPSRKAIAQVIHHPSLPHPRLPPFMKMMKSQPQSTSNLALEFTILTAARTGEVTGATWSEISEEKKLWTIPANRMKAGREHQVPLGDAALAVLKKMNHDGEKEFIFRGARYRRPISDMAMLQALRGFRERGLLDEHVVVHGFRSTFRMWCAEATDYPRELAEFSLAHAAQSDVEAAYNRGTVVEKRRLLMTDWEKYCLSECGIGGDDVAEGCQSGYIHTHGHFGFPHPNPVHQANSQQFQGELRQRYRQASLAPNCEQPHYPLQT